MNSEFLVVQIIFIKFSKVYMYNILVINTAFTKLVNPRLLVICNVYYSCCYLSVGYGLPAVYIKHVEYTISV